MNRKESLLTVIRQGLASDVISVDDLRVIIDERAAPMDTPVKESAPNQQLSVVDIMFYIAGTVLFGTIVSYIAQTWEDTSTGLHLLVSAGLGLMMWIVALVLIKNPRQNDIRRGMVNALLLTGALSIILGGFIAAEDFINESGGMMNYVVVAAALIALSSVHMVFDRFVRRDLIVLLGTVLGIGAIAALLSGLLDELGATFDAYVVMVIGIAGLLFASTRVLAGTYSARDHLRSTLDVPAGVIVLLAMYAASFGEYGVIWSLLLISAVFGLFYASIVTKRKKLLGLGSVFLILTVVTLSFKYFSGFGVTASLFVATIGLVLSGVVAAMINRKYFK